MEKILSICVPAYNIENYIDSCVLSMAKSKILDKIEIIIVNDGSSDGTLSNALELKERYPNSIVIIDKENGGHGSTINNAISNATGKYFKNVDGDDWVDTKAFEEYVCKLCELDVDVVFTDFTSVYVNSNKLILESMEERHKFPQNRIFDINLLLSSHNVPAMHSLTYKTKLLQTNNVSLNEHCFYVDVQYYTFPMEFVNSAYYLPLNVYQYRLEREGQSVSIEGIIKHFNDHLLVLQSIIDVYKTAKTNLLKIFYKKIIEGMLCFEIAVLFNDQVQKNNKLYKSIFVRIKSIMRENKLTNKVDLPKEFKVAMKFGCILGINTMPILKWGSNLCKKIKNH